jgi:hypothetical protein
MKLKRAHPLSGTFTVVDGTCGKIETLPLAVSETLYRSGGSPSILKFPLSSTNASYDCQRLAGSADELYRVIIQLVKSYGLASRVVLDKGRTRGDSWCLVCSFVSWVIESLEI